MTAEQILKICNTVMDCDITERVRTNQACYRRNIYYALCKFINDKLSLNEIGNVCGGRDHATVLNGLKVFYDVVVENEYYWNLYKKCLEYAEKLEENDSGRDVMDSILKDHIRILKKENDLLKGKMKRIKEISSI